MLIETQVLTTDGNVHNQVLLFDDNNGHLRLVSDGFVEIILSEVSKIDLIKDLTYHPDSIDDIEKMINEPNPDVPLSTFRLVWKMLKSDDIQPGMCVRDWVTKYYPNGLTHESELL